MWSAIIQAIDHAAGRMANGSKAGIDVANSQHGGSAAGMSAGSTGSGTTDTSQAGSAIGNVASSAKDLLSKRADEVSSEEDTKDTVQGVM